MSAAAIDALVCSVTGSLPLATLSAATVGRHEVVYRLDGHHGQIECSARQCGVFAVRGQLTGFACVLAFDRAAMRLLPDGAPHVVQGFGVGDAGRCADGAVARCRTPP
jgi:hypothetical protein